MRQKCSTWWLHLEQVDHIRCSWSDPSWLISPGEWTKGPEGPPLPSSCRSVMFSSHRSADDFLEVHELQATSQNFKSTHMWRSYFSHSLFSHNFDWTHYYFYFILFYFIYFCASGHPKRCFGARPMASPVETCTSSFTPPGVSVALPCCPTDLLHVPQTCTMWTSVWCGPCECCETWEPH